MTLEASPLPGPTPTATTPASGPEPSSAASAPWGWQDPSADGRFWQLQHPRGAPVLVRIAVGSETYERAVASTVGGHRDAGNFTMVRGAAIRIERTTIDAVVHADPAEGTASMRAPVGPTSDDEFFLVVDLNCIADLGVLQRLVARCRGSLLAVYANTARCHQLLAQMVAQRLRVHVAPAVSGFLEPLLRGALLHDPRSAVPLSEVIAPLLGANAELDGRDGASCAGGGDGHPAYDCGAGRSVATTWEESTISADATPRGGTGRIRGHRAAPLRPAAEVVAISSRSACHRCVGSGLGGARDDGDSGCTTSGTCPSRLGVPARAARFRVLAAPFAVAVRPGVHRFRRRLRGLGTSVRG
jgi:hypothetical protein